MEASNNMKLGDSVGDMFFSSLKHIIQRHGGGVPVIHSSKESAKSTLIDTYIGIVDMAVYYKKCIITTYSVPCRIRQMTDGDQII